jgi:hypothetical protein
MGLGFELRAFGCKACALHLEPHLQSIFALVILGMESHELFLSRLASKRDPPDLSLPST